MLFGLPSLRLCGQKDSTKHSPFANSYFAISPHYGFIVPHTSAISHLVQGHSYGVGFDLISSGSEYKTWRGLYNYPETGLIFFLLNTGNKDQLGYEISCSYFLNLTLNSYHRDRITSTSNDGRHWIGLGIGAGFTTKPWNLRENHQAPVLGSSLNLALTIQYSARLLSSKKFEIRSGLRIHHYSNGAFSVPNLGTNNASVFFSAGVKTAYTNIDYVPHSTDSFSFSNSISFSVGAKEIPPPIGKKYPVFSLNYLFDKRVSYKSSFGAGLDAFYNSSVKTLLERRDDYAPPSQDVLQLGASIGYTLHFSKFQLKVQNGIYLYDKWKDTGKFYHRFGLRYQLSKHWFAHMSLKTHFAKADFGEWGLGWKF